MVLIIEACKVLGGLDLLYMGTCNQGAPPLSKIYHQRWKWLCWSEWIKRALPASVSSLCLPYLDTGAALLHQRHSRAAAAPVQANRSKGVQYRFPCVFWKHSQLVPVCWPHTCTYNSFILTNRASGIVGSLQWISHVLHMLQTPGRLKSHINAHRYAKNIHLDHMAGRAGR